MISLPVWLPGPMFLPSGEALCPGNMIISLLMNIDDYYNEPIGRSFGNCDIYNTTITWLRKHEHMARYFPMFLVFGAKFQYFDNGE